MPEVRIDEHTPIIEQRDLPQGWVWTTINELSTHITSGSRGWAQYYAETGSIFVRVGNFNRLGTVLELEDVVFVNAPKRSEANRTRLQESDILLTITADVGMVGLVDERVLQWGEGFINQHVCLIRPEFVELSPFIAFALMAEPIQNQIRNRQYGLTKTGLGLDDVKALRIPLPPLPEQRRIVAAIETQLTRLDAGVASLKAANLRRAKRLRQAILKRAFAGKLVPQDPGDEPASALLERIRASRQSAVGSRPPRRDKREAEQLRMEDLL